MRTLGIDGGIASIGWAIIDQIDGADSSYILKCGTRMFNPPESQSSSGPFLKNAERRSHRLQRRIIRRRAQRMREIRKLFADHDLILNNDSNALAGNGIDPWKLRAEALERALEPKELALALGHIAKHRGFKSNRKGERIPNEPIEGGKAKTGEYKEKQGTLFGLAQTQQRLAAIRDDGTQYRTVGEMFARDPTYAKRKRNRDGDYTRSILRDDQEAEVRQIFVAQKRFGSGIATQSLLDAYCEIAFFQRPLKSSIELVGNCPFVETEKRASAYAPSFERFRFLSKLVALRIVSGRKMRALSEGEIWNCLADYGKYQGITWKQLRNVLGLAASERFNGVGSDKEKNDFVRSAGACKGTKVLENVLIASGAISELDWQKLIADGTKLDSAMAAIAFNEDIDVMRKALGETALDQSAVDALCKAALDGTFSFVKGTGHISCDAARRLNPHLEKGLRYHEACTAEGWDHAAQRAWKLDDIASPVAQKAAREIMKQVKVLEAAYGPFEHIHIEMAREIGKSIEERRKIESGLNKRTAARQKAESELIELIGVSYVREADILRYELWKEQNGECLYTGKGIPPGSILASDNSVQIDHILPFSRFADNSYLNKTLCFTDANQAKKNRTPFEWISADKPGDWDRFSKAVELCKSMKGIKKRNYLMMNAAEREGQFLERNLNDTRYALKVVLGLLKARYPDETIGTNRDGTEKKHRRVFARPGGITAALRRVWGLESLKKDVDGNRLTDDRHHALDAIVTACCSEGLLQSATRVAQEQERRGEQFELRDLPTPWGDAASFRRDVTKAVDNVFVSRPESGRIRGKGHDATIKAIREIDGNQRLVSRKSVKELTLKDLDRIPVPKPYGKISDPAKLRDAMVASLREWIEAGKPKDNPPRSPKRDVIKKVTLEPERKKDGSLGGTGVVIPLNGGSVDRADMVRVDVFSKPNARGKIEYYLVPIYRTDVYSRDAVVAAAPPNQAVRAYKHENEWPVIGDEYQFLFSLHSFSLIEVTRPNGEVIQGYFRGLDRSTGAISLSKHKDSLSLVRGIGAKTLLSFKKFNVDRLGCVHEVKLETRTWRGRACT